MRRSTVVLLLVLGGLLGPPGVANAASEDIAFVSDATGDTEIVLTTAAGGARVNLTRDPAQDDGPAWSPDGTQLAFASTRRGTWDLFVLDMATGDVRQLTGGASADFDPGWSPDGTTIVYERSRRGRREIRSIPALGGESTRVVRSRGLDLDPQYLPSGRIVFESDRGRSFDLWTVRSGGTPRPILRSVADEFHAAASRAGELAFERVSGGYFDLYRMRPGGAPRPLTRGRSYEGEPTWSFDGRRLAYVTDVDGDRDVVVRDLERQGLADISEDGVQDTAPAWRPTGSGPPPAMAFAARLLALSCPTTGIWVATGGANEFHGGPGDNTICGGGGDDNLYGGGGDDELCGDAGWDLLDGEAGNDRLHGGGVYSCGQGPDRLKGAGGDDRALAEGDGKRDCAWGGDGGNDRGRLYLGKTETGDSYGSPPWGASPCGSRKSFEVLE